MDWVFTGFLIDKHQFTFIESFSKEWYPKGFMKNYSGIPLYERNIFRFNYLF